MVGGMPVRETRDIAVVREMRERARREVRVEVCMLI